MKRLFGMTTTTHSRDYTVVALESFFRTTDRKEGDSFVLVDNDATWSEQALQWGEVFTPQSPRSFAENGNFFTNLARERSSSLYLLNNDLVFTPGWSAPLDEQESAITSPLSNREVQYCSSVLVSRSSNIVDSHLFTTPLVMKDYDEHREAFAYIASVHRRNSSGYHPVYMVPFFCIKLPYSVLQAVGDFDESFHPAGGEDYDYCVRAHLRDIPICFALQSYVLHFGGKSTWSGVESPEARHAREQGFLHRFRDKWGEPLYDLIFNENTEKHFPHPAIQQAHLAGELHTVVKALAEAGKKSG